jgi:hypothetical protein
MSLVSLDDWVRRQLEVGLLIAQGAQYVTQVTVSC